jgi:hypothetical protein
MKCPHCTAEIHMNLRAVIPEEQRLTFKIDRGESAGLMMSAATVAGFVGDMDKLMKSVAKQIGAKVHVFIDRIEWEDASVAFHVVIANVGGTSLPKADDLLDVVQQIEGVEAGVPCR